MQVITNGLEQSVQNMDEAERKTGFRPYLPSPQQFRNVFFGPENRNGIRAEQYIDDSGRPLFQRFVQLFFDVAKDEGLPGKDDIVVAHTRWYTIFGLATFMVICLLVFPQHKPSPFGNISNSVR
jgi:hypothetical protein